MSRYAESTSVSSEASRAEIERTLSRYGATGFMYGWDADRAILGFIAQGRQVKFVLPLPDRNDRRFTHTPARNQRRDAAGQAKEYDQAVRQSWRALALVIKAKLEAVAAGIVEFDAEFLAHLVLPGGATVFESVGPRVAAAIETGQVPDLLPRAITGGTDTDARMTP